MGPQDSHPKRKPGALLGRTLQLVFVAWMVVLGLMIGADLAAIQVAADLDHAPIRKAIEWIDDHNRRILVIGTIATLGWYLTPPLFIAWTWRLRLAVGQSTRHRHSRGWAIGAWLVPVVQLWRPKQIIDDLWRSSSSPDDDSDSGRQTSVPALVHLWWGVLLVSIGAMVLISGLLGDESTGQAGSLGAALVEAALAGSALLSWWLVSSLTRRIESRPALRGSGRALTLAAITLVTAGVGYTVWHEDLTVTTKLFAPRTATGRSVDGILLEDSFDAGSRSFVTETDRFVDLFIEDGAYRIRVKEQSPLQLARHFFPGTSEGLRFEATVTLVDNAGDEYAYGIGCWDSAHAYYFVMASSGEYGLLETVSEETGERLVLFESMESVAFRPRGQPNRLRLDCVGGDAEPTLVSAWLNGDPLVTVSIPGGADGFNAIGFIASAGTGRLEISVDDVIVVAEKPPAPLTPVAPAAQANGTGVSQASCDYLHGLWQRDVQLLLDQMAAWDSTEAFVSATEEEYEAVFGSLQDEFQEVVRRIETTGCVVTAELVANLVATNPVAEEMLKQLQEEADRRSRS